MELQVGVKVLLMNPDGKFLLIRRSADKYQEVQHKWDIPGGRIDAGSSLSENLAREVMEETGLTMTSEPYVVGAQDIFAREQDRHIVRVTYVGTAEGAPELSDEHTEYQWVTLSEMRSLPNLDRYVKALLEEGAIPSATD
jgi:8-oxo-dGTP diphosphatase